MHVSFLSRLFSFVMCVCVCTKLTHWFHKWGHKNRRKQKHTKNDGTNTRVMIFFSPNFFIVFIVSGDEGEREEMKWSRTHHRAHITSPPNEIRFDCMRRCFFSKVLFYYYIDVDTCYSKAALRSTFLFRFVCFCIDLYHLSLSLVYKFVCVCVWFICDFNIWKTSNMYLRC